MRGWPEVLSCTITSIWCFIVEPDQLDPVESYARLGRLDSNILDWQLPVYICSGISFQISHSVPGLSLKLSIHAHYAFCRSLYTYLSIYDDATFYITGASDIHLSSQRFNRLINTIDMRFCDSLALDASDWRA